MMLNLKNRLHRSSMNKPRHRHEHKYTIYKTKENLGNTWSSIHEKVKQHWGRFEKNRCL